MQAGLLERVVRVVLLTIVPMLAAAGTVLATTATVSVYGTVLDSRTKSPVADSQIVVSDEQGLALQLVSDAHGRYSAVGLAAGNITIASMKPGFMTETITCLVESGNSAAFNLAMRHGLASTVHSPARCPMQAQTQDSYTLR